MGVRKVKITTFAFLIKTDEALHEQVSLHEKSPHLFVSY